MDGKEASLDKGTFLLIVKLHCPCIVGNEVVHISSDVNSLHDMKLLVYFSEISKIIYYLGSKTLISVILTFTFFFQILR